MAAATTSHISKARIKEEKEMKMSDLLFEKEKYHDPYDDRSNMYGYVTLWVAKDKSEDVVASGRTKSDCIAKARQYIDKENEKSSC